MRVFLFGFGRRWLGLRGGGGSGLGTRALTVVEVINEGGEEFTDRVEVKGGILVKFTTRLESTGFEGVSSRNRFFKREPRERAGFGGKGFGGWDSDCVFIRILKIIKIVLLNVLRKTMN